MTKRIRIAIGSAAAVLLAVGAGLAIGLPAQAGVPIKATVSHVSDAGNGDGETADDQGATDSTNDGETADDSGIEDGTNDGETADDNTGAPSDGEDPKN